MIKHDEIIPIAKPVLRKVRKCNALPGNSGNPRLAQVLKTDVRSDRR
jgi:hypothetical protein